MTSQKEDYGNSSNARATWFDAKQVSVMAQSKL